MGKKEINQIKLGLHISYDNELSIKDLIDILDLYRKSINENFRNFGIKKRNLNSYCKIKSIKEGSIRIETVLEAIISLGKIADFCNNLLEYFKFLIENRRNRLDRNNSHNDNPVYNRNQININLEGTIINIHIHNLNEKVIEKLVINDELKNNH